MLYSRKYLLSFLFLFNIVSTLMSNPSAVQYVDLDRYMGRWYVIRNTPYFLEKDKVASYDTYTKRSDGKIEADFTFKKTILILLRRFGKEWVLFKIQKAMQFGRSHSCGLFHLTM